MDELNTKQRAFVRNYAIKGQSAGEAYGNAYKQANPYPSASRLLANVKITEAVKKAVQTVQDMAMQDVQRAYEIKRELMESKATPASVRNQISDSVIALSGQAPSQKIESKTETTHKGLNDITRAELKEMLA